MFEIFRLAFNELYSNKGRTILTSLGISVGVMSVSLILATGAIAQQYITGYLTKSIGKTTSITVNADFNSRAIDAAKVTDADYKYFGLIKGNYPIVDDTSLTTWSTTLTNTFDESINQTVKGSGVNYPKIAGNKNLQNINGRFFNQAEVDTGENVAVITTKIAREIRGKNSLLGEKLKLGKENFTVIGEFEGETSLTATDKDIIIPISSLWKARKTNDKAITQILYTVQTEEQIDKVSKAVLEDINKYRASNFSGENAKKLSTASSKSAIETISGVVIGFQLFLSMVAVISLVVGGIGVLNVMLMAVTQRIKEIGIRKAFGAKNRDILVLFLSESVTLTALSGLFGALLAQYLTFLGVTVVNNVVPGTDLIYTYNWMSVYIAFLLSAIIGVMFGLYPSSKAGQMSVVDALRYD
jgi:putative ABC transport system permease protein